MSETAPKIDEPIINKPIDTAAVTAPVDTVQTPSAVEETPEEIAPAETTSTPTKEKKGGIIGFIRKQEASLLGKKEQKKEEKVEKKDTEAAEQMSKDPVAAAAPVDSPAPTTEAAPATTTTEETRPSAREKRRTSLFGSLGTLKKKNADDETEATTAEPKREKSPLPQKIGNLFRRPSKAVKTNEEKKETVADTDESATAPAPLTKDEPAMTNGMSSSETPGSAIVGDNAPENVHASVHNAVTSSPEVEAAA